MSTAALFQRLRDLVAPTGAPLIGEVMQVHSDNTSTVEFPDGTQQRVRGTIVAVGSYAFIRNGVVESVAPARTATVIEI